ncbi:MAG: tetratricopeptide repeat protein [Myxococcota bacterium]|nr:tetratricopeptide repeat protein [Myxococcota bacterium]
MSAKSYNDLLNQLDLPKEKEEQLVAFLHSLRSDEELLSFILNMNRTPVPQKLESICTNATMDMFQTESDGNTDTSHDISKETYDFFASANTIDVITDRFADEESVDESNPLPDQTQKRSGEESPSNRQSTTMLGKYIDLGRLGIGGMGEVRKVRDESLKRTMAMKIIHRKLLMNRQAISRFVEEAQVCAQLQHPNIVPVHELGKLPDGRLYFTMKEIRGTEFSKLIRAVHQVSEPHLWHTTPDGTSFRRLIQIFYTICETVAFSHSLGVIHRDLKPENIMIGGFGEVLVVDWGIAKVLGVSDDADDHVSTSRSIDNWMVTQLGSISGTPSYMSPEQARGDTKNIGEHADIYSLGAILYEILSGKPPFLGRSAIEILEKVKRTAPPVLVSPPKEDSDEDSLEFENKMPDMLVNICQKAMQREVEDRHESAEQLAQEILAWLDGAQRREKALAEMEKASMIRKESRMRKEESNYLWSQANRLIQQMRTQDTSAWLLWEKAQKSRKEHLLLETQYQHCLRGALVYDPEIAEVHHKLANEIMDSLTHAIAKGDRARRESLLLEFKEHCRYLPSDTRETLQKEFGRITHHSLRVQRAKGGPLIGHQDSKQKIRALLSSPKQIVSLIGPAGIGKSRLALELGHEFHIKEAYVCDLTEATDPIGILRLVAQTLQLRLSEEDPTIQIRRFLSKTPLLLILDNVERVAIEAGVIVQDWLSISTSLRVIVTSRVPLQIPEEVCFSVPPLQTLEAMELFMRRGQQIIDHFTLTEENRLTIGRIVEKLEYLPLAIKLTAARLNRFSVTQIERQLQERFSLVQSDVGDARALHTALDWSWELLKPWAKEVLSQASVFRGGFNDSAAEHVLLFHSQTETPDQKEILRDLCRSQLIQTEQSADGQTRYKILESIQLYMREKGLSPTEKCFEEQVKIETERRHAKYFARFGTDDYLASLDAFGGKQKWNTLAVELDNLVAGTRRGSGEHAVLCCLAALRILKWRGPISLGVQLAEELLERPELSMHHNKLLQLEKSKLLLLVGRTEEAYASLPAKHTSPGDKLSKRDSLFQARLHLEYGLHHHQASKLDSAIEEYEAALSLYETFDYRKGEAETYNKLGKIALAQNKFEAALVHFRTACQLAGEIGYDSLRGGALGNMGVAYDSQGNSEEALLHYQQSVAIFRELRERRGEGIFLGNIGIIYESQGKSEEALVQYKRALKLSRLMEDRKSEGNILGNLGNVYQMMGRYEEALRHLQDGLTIMTEIGFKRGEGIIRCQIGELLLLLHRSGEAKTYLIDAIHICEEAFPICAGSAYGSLSLIYAEEENRSEAYQALQKGEPLVLVEPKYRATFLCRKATVFHRFREWENAQKSLREAEEIARSLQLHAGPLVSLITQTKTRLNPV